MADSGTLFLDEIANMPLAQQASSLRVLETGEFERVGSSRTRTRGCAHSLGDQCGPARPRSPRARFREDLLFRLNTIEIRMPPLRERREDIPLLAAHFLRAVRGSATGSPSPHSNPAAMRCCSSHAWPGNVRELDHAVERAALMAQGEQVARRRSGVAPRAVNPGVAAGGDEPGRCGAAADPEGAGALQTAT